MRNCFKAILSIALLARMKLSMPSESRIGAQSIDFGPTRRAAHSRRYRFFLFDSTNVTLLAAEAWRNSRGRANERDLPQSQQDVHETMLDPGKCNHPLAALGVVAQTPCDVAANLNLHSGLAKVDIAAVAQFKAHHVLHDP